MSTLKIQVMSFRYKELIKTKIIMNNQFTETIYFNCYGNYTAVVRFLYRSSQAISKRCEGN